MINHLPDNTAISKVKEKKNIKIDFDPSKLVYLCYRYKKIDPKIDQRTILEAKKCKRDGIEIDSIVISDEQELLQYTKEFEHTLHGKTYHIKDADMNSILITDYLSNTSKVLNSIHNL
jgi:uncharacterized protein with von Willebrand factor type A (vWA) domain